MCDALCCQSLEDRDELAAWMIQSDDATLPPSLCQRCLCQCGPAARLPSGIEKIPEISSLAGATLQDGTHSTAGSVQTLKWADFDAHKHTARMQVFGGAFTGRGATGVWTEPNKCTWNCLINLARCFNYTYFFEFSPDWRKADIKIQSSAPRATAAAARSAASDRRRRAQIAHSAAAACGACRRTARCRRAASRSTWCRPTTRTMDRGGRGTRRRARAAATRTRR